MTQRFLLLLLFIAAFGPAYSQQSSPRTPALFRLMRDLPWHTEAHSQQKTTGLPRLRAQSTYRFENGQFALADSFAYTYGGGRTSQYVDEGPGYFNELGYLNLGYPIVDFDSAYYLLNTAGFQPGYFTLSHDAAGRPQLRRFDREHYSAELLTYSPNGQKRAYYSIYDYVSGPVVDSEWRSLYHYNAQGLMETDSEQQYLGNGQWKHWSVLWNTYDAAGRRKRCVYSAEGINFYDSASSLQFTYNAAGKLLRVERQYYTGNGTWKPDVIDSFAYNGAELFRMRTYLVDSLGTPTFRAENLRYANAAGLTDSIRTVYTQDGIDWDTSGIRVFFNAAMVPVRMDRWEHYNQGILLYERKHYYYEGGLGTGKETAQLLKVHPNPVDGKLSLELPAGDHYQAEISGADGRLWKSYSFGAAGKINLELEVPHLPPGVYTLVLRGQKGAGYRAVFQKR